MAAHRKKQTRESVRPSTPQAELADLEARAVELRELIRVQRRFSPEAVREHRHRLGITAAQYASLLGVSMQMVYGWEEGYARPKPDHLFRWIELLDTEEEVALKPLGLVPVRQVSPRQLRAERKRLGLSQEQYGALLGVEQATISTWESARVSPSRESLLRLETVWGIGKSEAEKQLERGRSVRVRGAPGRGSRRRPPRRQSASRRWPNDPTAALAKIEKRADRLRAIVEAKGQFSAEAVREHRRELGLSARAYGELIGVSTQAVYGWEKGRFEIWSRAVDEIRGKSRGDLGAVLELHSSDDVSEQLVSVQLPPLALGGLSELEDHRQARDAGA